MKVSKKKLVLYGLGGYNKTVDQIINDLDACDDYFDIKLILVEALTNTFNYGNKGDKNQPIYIVYSRDGSSLLFEIQGTESDSPELEIPDEISDENILNEHGRGLYLIKCLVDKLERIGGTLYIKKNLRMGD